MKKSSLSSIVNLFFIAVIIGSLFEIAEKSNYSLTQFADSFDKEHKLGKYSKKKEVIVKHDEVTENPQKEDTYDNELVVKKVLIHGFGDYDAHDLVSVGQGIEEYYDVPVIISDPHEYIRDEFFLDNGYIESHKTLTLLEYSNDVHHVFVTNLPICAKKNDEKLLSGYALIYHTKSIVSTYQLKQHNKYQEFNLQNIANHELAHNLGVTHCGNENCIMLGTTTGIKQMCDICKKQIKQPIYD